MPNSNRSRSKFMDTAKVLNLSGASVKDRLAIIAAETIVGISKLNSIMDEVRPTTAGSQGVSGNGWPSPEVIINHLFKKLDIEWFVTNPAEMDDWSSGAKIFVLNHPYGLPDALALHRLLVPVSPDVRIFANTLLAATHVDKTNLLFVDPFMAPQNRAMNRKSVASAVHHLKAGNDLALFPGRICSHLRKGNTVVSDGPWTDQILRFSEVSGAEIIPIHISGHNSKLFNQAGLIHPRLRTLLLLREFLRGGHRFAFTIGKPIDVRTLQRTSTIIPPGKFARAMTYLQNPAYAPGGKSALATRASAPGADQKGPDAAPSPSSPKPVKARSPASFNPSRMSGLRELLKHKDFSVFATEPGLETSLVDPIAQLRFEAFSAESEIKDAASMIDGFDQHYSHLVLWDNKSRKMAGTYRFMLPEQNLSGEARKELVTSSIFDLSGGFSRLLPKSVELGRAAIGRDYQKSYSPLMLLWRGILSMLIDQKQVKYLFGPVTMGSSFSPISRELLHRFIMRNSVHEDMLNMVRPLNELELPVPPEINLDAIVEACESLSDVATLVDGFESGKRRLPVLFRHYANFGSRYVAFGEWKELGNATAGLTVLDLTQARRDFLSRYLGTEGAADFISGR